MSTNPTTVLPYEVEAKGTCGYTIYESYPFAIKVFKLDSPLMFPDGKERNKVTIKGNYLPDKGFKAIVWGNWEKAKNPKYHDSINVVDSDRLKEKTKEGIIKYMQSLKGVGPTLAKNIYKEFGLKTFDILDEDIDNLKQVKGIGKKKFEIIKSDYLSKGEARALYAYLMAFNVGRKYADRLYGAFKENALEMVKTSPHQLFINGYLGFDAAEAISRDNQLDERSTVRIKAIIVHELLRNESRGNTYSTWGELLRASLDDLGMRNECREFQIEIGQKIRRAAKALNGSGIRIKKSLDGSEAPLFYLPGTAYAEYDGGEKVKILLRKSPKDKPDYSKEIDEAEKKLAIKLSDEQRLAVEKAMDNSVSIVTGGPGTGKTSFQKVLFYVYRKKYPRKQITLAAPTGRAARRMTESSGLPAKTLHSLLQLSVKSDDEGDVIKNGGSLENPEPIPEGLLVVDETSMLDIFLFEKLFEAIQEGTKVVLVGDIYQLPSVGCGTVLKSLIESGVVPTTTFTQIFRQDENSSVAWNAKRINNGTHRMKYDQAFQFLECPKQAIQGEVLRQYQQAINEFGIDEVAVLTPYRRKTETGVNRLNPCLRELINPPKGDQKVHGKGGCDLYPGDKVMYTVNDGDLTNGDMGYIQSVALEDKSEQAVVDFGDGRVVTLTDDELENLVLAYATTIHKSQGSEYKCCIIVLDMEHRPLLKRNLVYTGITRAKERVILVGEKEAFDYAIDREDTSTRHSQLKEILKEINLKI